MSHVLPSSASETQADLRQRAEERLRRSEACLAEAERLSHTGSWVWSASSGELFWSQEHFRICGVDPEYFKPTIEGGLALIHPEDRTATIEAFQSVTSSGTSFEKHLRILRPDGTIRHVHSLAHPVFNESGEVVEYVGTIVDHTDRKRVEDELRRSETYLAEGQRLTHTGSWGWKTTTGELYWSQEQFRIFERHPQHGAPAIDGIFELIHPDDREHVRQAFETAVREPTDYHWDCRIVSERGTVKSVHMTAHPVFTGGRLTEVVGTVMDTSERRRAEAERARLLERLVTAHEDERARISREMHDELGQHLSALSLRIAVLKRDCGRQANLREQVSSLEALVRQLEAEIEFLVWSLRPTALDDIGLVAAFSNLVNRWMKHVGIRVDLHTGGLGAVRLRRDMETMLYRVLQEALTNVAKHARATNVSIVLDSRDDIVSLIIEDDGRGFDATHRTGTSLGLVGIRERAAVVGASVEIESQPGAGTTIAIRLPVAGAARIEGVYEQAASPPGRRSQDDP